MADKTFTETETKLLTTVLESAARDGSFNSLCDWDAIAAKLSYGSAKSARDTWNRLSAKKLRSDPGADGATTAAAATPSKRKKAVAADKEAKSPSPKKKSKNMTTEKDTEIESTEMDETTKRGSPKKKSTTEKAAAEESVGLTGKDGDVKDEDVEY